MQTSTGKMTIVRLQLLMFLQYFIWGGWYTTIAVYMLNSGMGDLTHWPYTVTPLAAMISPLILGLIADRLFQAQKVVATLHVMGGIFMLLAPATVHSPVLFIFMLFLFNLCYMPTLALTNSLIFYHISEPEKQFPMIRVFGTVGWIVAGLVISFGLIYLTDNVVPEKTALPLFMSGSAAILLGIFSLTLPETPPSAKGVPVSIGGLFGFDALKELGSTSFYIFLTCVLLICIPLAAYYNFTQIFLESVEFRNIAAIQTLGQISEVFFMLLLPFFFIRLGTKWVLVAGMGAWALRYFLFAVGAPDGIVSLIVLGILLHGICYDFLFVAGQIYVERLASPLIRSQAQSLFVFLTYGLGMLVGAQVAGRVYNALASDAGALTGSQFQLFWLLPAFLSVIIMFLFAVLFKPERANR